MVIFVVPQLYGTDELLSVHISACGVVVEGFISAAIAFTIHGYSWFVWNINTPQYYKFRTMLIVWIVAHVVLMVKL